MQPGGKVDYQKDWNKISMNEKVQFIKGFLGKKGYTPPQIGAIIGNLIQENDTLVTSRENKSSGALGIAQWLGPRKKALMSTGNPYNIVTQLEYLDKELRGNEHWTNNIGGKKRFFETDNIDELTMIIRKDFERPGEHEANDKARIRNAYAVMDKVYNGKGGAPQGVYPQGEYPQQNYQQPAFDTSMYAKMLEDMRQGLWDWSTPESKKTLNQSPELASMMMNYTQTQEEIMRNQKLADERARQEQLKKDTEIENQQIQEALVLKQQERERILSMVPQSQSITQKSTSQLSLGV